ncbi:Fe(3+) ABC transporter substrate-binding protein [Altericista sp. CCNU0014]|uniref:Fe(3+) ABC transporter substrate-binding protein n=1 Tax=Altericista sp. CCNU0014 TaxID=3082949 RepID=UPI00384B6218
MAITRRVFLASGTAAAAVVADRMLHPNVGRSAERVMNLYSARHYSSDTAIYESFTKKTGIKVNLVESPGDKLIERIKSEGANSPADVIITVDAGNLWRAQEAGLFQPVSSRILTGLDASARDPQGHWFGFTRRARIVAYNKAKVKPEELSTYEALTDGKWKGRILVRSSGNVYNQSLVGSILAAHGEAKTEEWARGLVANFARPPEGNDTAQIKAIAAGLGDVALVNTYYIARLAKSDKAEDRDIAAKVGIFFPNQKDRGTHVNISGGGVAKNAPNKAAAILFLEHLASRQVQEIFAKSNYEYPVLSGAPVDPILTSFGKFKADKLNASVYGKNNALALQICDRAGWK